MVPPVQVSPLIKLGRYSALFLGVAYGAKRYSYLKPRAEEERRIAAEEKKQQDERKRIERELAEGSSENVRHKEDQGQGFKQSVVGLRRN
ncbi:ATP synthase subunit e, mitochondrial isoform X1 [Lynx canadensis]|uniref:ATP synthase subunit e, mitochondrial isoform X1 n=1 Tax=Lynx canadensis TaxID=61383 RepID=UPI0011AFEE9A|nr:ATP synthase subunit e, mitochondrial isoform X1 [Lynx canadensis]XP_046950218.1 ATP synthase subunit e, mitochondrial isoform X1 [Lynx rufus]